MYTHLVFGGNFWILMCEGSFSANINFLVRVSFQSVDYYMIMSFNEKKIPWFLESPICYCYTITYHGSSVNQVRYLKGSLFWKVNTISYQFCYDLVIFKSWSDIWWFYSWLSCFFTLLLYIQFSSCYISLTSMQIWPLYAYFACLLPLIVM